MTSPAARSTGHAARIRREELEVRLLGFAKSGVEIKVALNQMPEKTDRDALTDAIEMIVSITKKYVAENKEDQ